MRTKEKRTKMDLRLKVGDKVKTTYYPKDSNLVREVIRIREYPGASESGWEVTTRDQKGRILSCDMNWYHLVSENES